MNRPLTVLLVDFPPALFKFKSGQAEVLDQDKITKDDLISEAELTVAEVMRVGTSVALRQKGKDAGLVFLLAVDRQ